MKVLIADDHKLMAAGLSSMLKNNSKHIEVVGTVNNGLEALNFIKANEVDVVLMDIDMPIMNGIDASRKVKALYGKKVKILILTMYDSIGYVIDAVEAGVDGYILKNTSPNEMSLAISELYAGNTHFDQKAMSKLTRDLGTFENVKDVMVSEKELNILQLICQGLKTADIGDTLKYSKSTITSYKHLLFLKFKVNTVEELVKKAVLNGFVRE